MLLGTDRDMCRPIASTDCARNRNRLTKVQTLSREEYIYILKLTTFNVGSEGGNFSPKSQNPLLLWRLNSLSEEPT